MSEPTPFKIAVSDDLLSFINQRVKSARLPPEHELSESEAWSQGTPLGTMKHLKEYWVEKYDWRAVEAELNAQLKMFTLPINESGEDLTMHFVHHRSEHKDAIPFLFLHGWPGSFLEVRPIIDLLTSPTEPGQQAYHVVAPSLPGFCFSSYPKKPYFTPKKMAAVNNKIMLALGYSKYMVQGGDWGSIIARAIAIDWPQSCVAIHVNMVVGLAPSPIWNPLQLAKLALGWMTPYEKTLMGRVMWWLKEEFGYLEIQGTKPQTISYALTDSPLGMLAWIRDKVQHIVDDDFTWEDKEIITWAMMYIIPGTPGHAEIYQGAKGGPTKEDIFEKIISRQIPFGASIFPKDASYAPRWWAECRVASNIVFWKEHEKGGHFASLEKPAELVQDVRNFTKVINSSIVTEMQESGK